MFPSDFNPEKKTRQRYFARGYVTEAAKVAYISATYKVAISLEHDDWLGGNHGMRPFVEYLFDALEDKSWDYKADQAKNIVWVEVVGVANHDEAKLTVKRQIDRASNAFNQALSARNSE